MLRSLQALGRRRVLLPVSLGSLFACGSPPPTAPTVAPSPIVTEPKEKPVDLSPVPEPAQLVMVGRVSKPESLLASGFAWAHLPFGAPKELVRSIADDGLADVVDLSQPIDGAMTVELSRAGVDPVYAFAVSVRGFETAKRTLGEQHRLVPGPNGQLKVEGIGSERASRSPRDRAGARGDGDPGEDEGTTCVLAHAAPSSASVRGEAGDVARLVCGSEGFESLVPFLTRTMPREKWTTDDHVEVRPQAVRAPLSLLLPMVARTALGARSPAARDFVDAATGEIVDVVSDTQKVTFDGQVAESGLDLSMRAEFVTNKSVTSRIGMVPDRADIPPPAFFHLPEDTDTAFFGRGSDANAKLFDRPRELLANLLIEAADASGMPEAEKKAVRELVADRTLALFANGGTGVYAKGYDPAAVERVSKARSGLKWDDTPAQAEAKKAVAEQVVGWHLYQLSEPLAKVGPMLKDWSALWNRPSFVKWVESKVNGGSQGNGGNGSQGGGPAPLPRMRIAPLPAGVALPKDTVHLELSVPRDDVDDERGMAAASANGGGSSRSVKASAKPKKVRRSPVVFHVFAVPDGGATWLAFGLDAKLVAQKAAASLASAPDAGTLGKASSHEALRERLRAAGKMNGAVVATIRGAAILAALDRPSGKNPTELLASLPSKGNSPILLTAKAEAPSAAFPAGASSAVLHVSRPVIEDLVKLVFASR